MAERTATRQKREDAELETLLQYLNESRGFDFTGYKRSTLQRRIQKRLETHGVTSYQDYQDLLEVTPDEFTELFDTILINVTGFFRDQPAWDFVASDVIQRLLEQKPRSAPLRVWSAACSSGEEAYTVAMLLAEALGEDDFRRRVKIYATDIDEDALNSARHAIFDAEAVKPVPKALLEKYFEPTQGRYAFRGDIRRSVIFGRNDLVQDAPISHIDLLVSRNALMYFTRETQARILAHFNFALEDDGFLFLGKSEMLLTHADLFTPHNMKWRVFTKVKLPGLRDRLAVMGDGALGAALPAGDGDLRAGAADSMPVAQVVVDRNGFVVGVNEAARLLFSLGPADVGRPFQDLSVSYRPVDLRSALERAYADMKPLVMGRVELPGDGGSRRTLVPAVAPIVSHSGLARGASITFQDVTELAKLDEDHERSKRQLETAYEELQSTVEELETTNEELETMNDEQRSRAREMDRLNLFLEGILGNLGVGVVVVDMKHVIQIWNASSQDLWGIRSDEAEGRSLFALDIGLPLGELREPLQEVLQDPTAEREVKVQALNRRGRTFNCTVRALPLTSPDGSLHGAILLMSERDGGL